MPGCRPCPLPPRCGSGGGLHAGPCRAPAAARTDRLLGGGRHAGDHGGLDHHHRHLFRVPRGRAHAADRTPGRDAVRLRGPHRRAARRRSIASPAASCSTRSSSSRSSIRSCAGRPRSEAALRPRSTAARPSATGSIKQPARAASLPRQALADQRQGRRSSCRSTANAPIDPRTSIHRQAAWRHGRRARPPAGVARPGRAAPERRRSIRSRRATTPRRGASAACSPISASTPARSRPRAPAPPADRSCRVAPAARTRCGFERQLQRIKHRARASVDRLTRTLGSVAGAQAGRTATSTPSSGLRRAHRSVHCARPRCIPGSISTARPAIRCAPPPTAR